MFLLVRHPSYNQSTGHLDTLGITQTKVLAQAIEQFSFEFKRIITSPSPRTREMTKILVKELGVMWQEDLSLAAGENPEAYFPPRDLSTLILVTHAPILSILLKRWSTAFHLQTPPPLEVGQAYLIDARQQLITPFAVQPN